MLKQDNAYIVFEVLVCNDASKKAGDPACKPKKIMKLADESSDELFPIETLIAEGKDLTLYEEDPDADSIDNFTKNKKIAMKIINQKIDFTTFGDYAVRQNELFAPSIPMRSPSYSDTGYRFRYNQFDRTDGYMYPDNDQDIFFDYFEYNTDIYKSAPLGLENVIAEMYYRLEVDQITHGRVVYNFMDFIGDLGGVPAIMLQLAGWVIGSYSAFHASFATMSALYRVKSNDKLFLDSKQSDPSKPELQKIKLPLCTRVFLWT